MKKMTSKIISVVLAALLALSSMPFVALADDATAAIEDAILYYEQAMDGRVRVNMTAAYDAYVEANKALDAYKYGNVDLDLDTYANTLNAKVDQMTEWSYNGTASVTPYFGDDTGDNSAYAANGVANILYWGSPLEGDGAKYTSGTIANVEIELWYPANTVLLLDGKATPAMPVMAMAKKNTGNNRYVYQIYPSKSNSDNSASQYFKLGTTADNTVWYGSNGNANRNKNWIWTIGRTSGTDTGRVKGEAGDNSTNTALNLSRRITTNYWASIANTLRFYGSQSEYSKSYTIDWYAVSGDKANDTRFMSPNMQIHVINYKALLDTIEAKKSYLSVSEDTYTQGGLRNVLAAYDQATAVNPSGYDYSNTDNVTAAGNAISSADTALNNATATTDTTGYANLGKAINAKKSIYEAGAEGYTAESWAAFVDAYEAAVDVFANIQTTGYNDSASAQTKADDLNAVVLVPNVEKVDSTALELAIDEANDAISNKAMFTSASYNASNIESVVAAAKTAVWGAEANYPNAKFKLDLSAENEAIVGAQEDLVKSAVYALRIDKDSTVLTAGNNSMNSAVALAANYSSDDYGNYADLASAVAAANNFVVTVNNLTKDCVTNKISEYKEKVRAVINAINLLRPAFDKITNGTFGSFAIDNSTQIKSTGDGYENWTLSFVRNNNVVVFRTDYAPMKIDLGGATLEWYTKEAFDAHLDSINVYDISEENKIGEIAASGAAFFFVDPSAIDIEDVADQYPGMLSASTEQNSTYVLKNLTVSSSAASKLGCDLEGAPITDTSFIFDELLSNTEGANSQVVKGTVTTNSGSAWINGEYTLSVPREAQKTLSATTLPTMTEHTLSSNFGMVYYWKYTNTGIRWLGYSHDRVPYTQTTYVMNIAPLMELINTCKTYQDKEQLYQISAWNNFTAALSAARADMDYGNMAAADIEAACQTRYTNLWNAYVALLSAPAASNASIHSAVEADEAVGNTFKADNKDGRWSASRWATFKTAYEAAAAAIAAGGKYSDVNVRNYGPDEQDAIDAIASALTTAYNELITYGPRADFSALYKAAQDIVVDAETGLETHTLANDVYTSESLGAISEALADSAQFPYLNMTEAEKNAVYSETAEVNAIKAEVEAINALYASVPVAADVDADALAAAQANAKASIKDPDAYGNIDEIKALIDAANYSEDVTIYGDYTVSGVRYKDQAELNAAIEALLSGLTVKKYDVKVVDEQGTAVNVKFEDMNGNEIASENGEISIDYGTRIRAYSPENEDADWFYSYNSNTVDETASKYYTTDKWINFTVKGNTTLTIKSAQAETETVKITYVNALTGKTFSVDYAEKNQEYSLTSAPVLAYYDFLGYSVNEESEEYVTSIVPTEDTVIVANYEPSETAEYYTVTIGNLSASVTTTQAISNLDYNDLVEFTLGDGTADAETGGLYRSTNTNGQYKVNGEVKALTGRGVRYRGSEIYAWVIIGEDDTATWSSYRKNPGLHAGDLADMEKVVMYGDSYSFRVHESVYVIPYTQAEFEEAVESGYVETGDENKAASFVKENIVNETNGDRISMIGSFTLPAGEQYSLVESGILFKATTDGTIPAADLTLNSVGTNGIARMKSSQHTVGNQYVISVNTAKLHNVTINAIYRAYMIYTDGTNQYIVYSNAVTDSADIA